MDSKGLHFVSVSGLCDFIGVLVALVEGANLSFYLKMIEKEKVICTERVLNLKILFQHHLLCVSETLLYLFNLLLLGTPANYPYGIPLPDRKILEVILDKLQKYVFLFCISQFLFWCL